ncbi:MAG: four helix bundle protein [Nitrospirota bacterium]
MKGDDIAERLIDFGVRIITIVNALPKTIVGRHVGGQLLWSGTSAGANYEEARGAESKADFVHKMGIVLKELLESRYWLKVVKRAQLLSHTRLQNILDEAEELCKMIGKSVLTAKAQK